MGGRKCQHSTPASLIRPPLLLCSPLPLPVCADAFSEGLVLVDVSQPHFPVVFVSEGWESLTGYSISEVVGVGISAILEVSQ